MSDRLNNFRKLREHLIIGKLFKGLPQAAIEECEQFILDNKHLDTNGFTTAVNRWLIDDHSSPFRGKVANKMWALVSQSVKTEIIRRKS